MSRRILVIADDLSGAAEIAGIGWRCGLKARLERTAPLAAGEGLRVDTGCLVGMVPRGLPSLAVPDLTVMWDHAATVAHTRAKLASSASPSREDFSGWNWAPYTPPRSTIDANASP